jgi:glycosyltransferase involved in cell wall biosynthesis
MKLLLCCESYYPARGGVQEVMKQIAERMAAAGHNVSVAARKQPDRISNVHNGVRIHEFDVSGNLVSGLRGEVDRYQEFIKNFDGDAILIKAAQQWSFDALWPILDQVKVRKVFVPCGFSCFYEPDYADYFAQLPDILRKFDHLIFYAEKYRDIDFAKAHGITTFSIIPNGASEIDFGRPADGRLRAKLGIPADDLLFLTVGTPINAKGHKEVGEAFAEMDLGGRNATLILNGTWPEPSVHVGRPWVPKWLHNTLRKARRVAHKVRAVAPLFLRPNTMRKGLVLLYREGWGGVWDRLFPKPTTLPAPPPAVAALPTATPSPPPPPRLEVPDIIGADRAIKEASGTKRILCLDMPREDVISAFLEADLFVFASKVEYSPLVLFEAAASGTPFLTVAVGNSREIVRWTGGGWICPAEVDERGYIKVSPAVLAREMEKAVHSPEFLRRLSEAGKQAWRNRFTWATIAQSYERILRGETVLSPMQGALQDRVLVG